MIQMAEEWITVPQAAREFRVSDSHIYNLVKGNIIQAMKPDYGNGIRVNREELRKHFEQVRKDSDK